ncbi:hypothetical protein K3G63_10565 [Hymenobacter sp. HSC-4F20]|uniref:hypothetical protein n=1 Tax=Hymenobacter sp. HSC-4F20 TaxID=2864135 RepID=UPI001C72FA22|nr:hypothetical protein [Hymenobacter sp. HSC-4F20]MBX0290884.1 hypothetical protein [Hymenobacter sp. HSC-4F20]
MESTFNAAPAPAGTSLGRWLAGAQQLKDTLTIVGLNFMLLFGLLIFGLPIPGLILYALRWRLVRGKATRPQALRIWSLSLGHELLCALLFFSQEIQQELGSYASWIGSGYLLGAAISAVSLAEAESWNTEAEATLAP